jgi:uracil-DNA glycosylase
MNKTERLDQLRRELMEAQLLPPCRSKESIVFGEGSPEARLMVVGEAPGQQEEEQGRPFVGRSGQLLRHTLEEAGIAPAEVWISNVVKCRPTIVRGGRIANRAPTASEALPWLPWLMKQIEIIAPAGIVCLGNLAAEAVIHKGFKMTREHGQWYAGPHGAAAVATYHPSYVMRQIGPSAEEVRRQFAADIAAAIARLRLPL